MLAELLRRYGDVMTAMTIYPPYWLDQKVDAQFAADLRMAAQAW